MAIGLLAVGFGWWSGGLMVMTILERLLGERLAAMENEPAEQSVGEKEVAAGFELYR